MTTNNWKKARIWRRAISMLMAVMISLSLFVQPLAVSGVDANGVEVTFGETFSFVEGTEDADGTVSFTATLSAGAALSDVS
ncbi:MAG: hypothetical protein LBN30_05675, partial [Oscillospiraceae bacterium]|nr:hypothetical protein [Oscillospiraceae bacterium]